MWLKYFKCLNFNFLKSSRNIFSGSSDLRISGLKFLKSEKLNDKIIDIKNIL